MGGKTKLGGLLSQKGPCNFPNLPPFFWVEIWGNGGRSHAKKYCVCPHQGDASRGFVSPQDIGGGKKSLSINSVPEWTNASSRINKEKALFRIFINFFPREIESRTGTASFPFFLNPSLSISYFLLSRHSDEKSMGNCVHRRFSTLAQCVRREEDQSIILGKRKEGKGTKSGRKSHNRSLNDLNSIMLYILEVERFSSPKKYNGRRPSNCQKKLRQGRERKENKKCEPNRPRHETPLSKLSEK